MADPAGASDKIVLQQSAGTLSVWAEREDARCRRPSRPRDARTGACRHDRIQWNAAPVQAARGFGATPLQRITRYQGRVLHLRKELPMSETDGNKEAEQIQIARAIGQELTDAFVGYVRGRIGFDELTFGVYDAMSDLHAVASGDYELTDDHDHDHDHGHHQHEHEHGYDDQEATEEQEELAQEPSRDARS
jgi:hypothetical protein